MIKKILGKRKKRDSSKMKSSSTDENSKSNISKEERQLDEDFSHS